MRREVGKAATEIVIDCRGLLRPRAGRAVKKQPDRTSHDFVLDLRKALQQLQAVLARAGSTAVEIKVPSETAQELRRNVDTSPSHPPSGDRDASTIIEIEGCTIRSKLPPATILGGGRPWD